MLIYSIMHLVIQNGRPKYEYSFLAISGYTVH